MLTVNTSSAVDKQKRAIIYSMNMMPFSAAIGIPQGGLQHTIKQQQ